MGWWRKKKPEPNLERGAMLLEDLIECCDGKSNPIKFFSAEEIGEATDSFSKSNHVSELFNFYCEWYTGKNENHPITLIKKVLRSSHWYQDDATFCRDIAISSMVSGHKNFMKLVGCCLEFECPAIVYHGEKEHDQLNHILSRQTWKRRVKIAEDIATALAYLHTAFPSPFVYRILSLEKILLDEDGVAKLSDFSYCVLIPKGETFVKVKRVVRLCRFMDKKYLRNGIVSERTDVFAIGLLMLTLLIGEKRFSEFYKSKDDESMDKIADPKMLEKMGEISEGELCQMKAFLMLSHRCISEVEVPTMVEVAKELKKIQTSLKNDSSSPLGETQFDSPKDIASFVLNGLRGEVAKEQKKIQRSLKNSYHPSLSSSLSPSLSPSPSPSDEDFDSPR